jgi:predicted nucleic acid-binding protein
MYLLDTNVISELRKPRPHGAVIALVQDIADQELFLSAITIGELQRGAELTRRQDSTTAEMIERWIDRVVMNYAVLPLDAPICREWARLMEGKSKDLLEDAMIAATARLHRLTIVTRNTTDFVLLDVLTLNPFTFTSAD